MCDKTKNVIKVLAMSTLLVFIFVMMTYFFRNTSTDRQRIIGLDDEKTDVDIVMIGGSSLFTYWSPMTAWEEYGITSYDYCTNALAAEFYEPLIKQAEKCNDTKLYVVELRSLIEWSSSLDEQAIRNPADSLPIFSKARWEGISEYLGLRNATMSEKIPYYFDIIKYHEKGNDAFSSIANYKYCTNYSYNPFKGYELSPRYNYVYEPADFETNEMGELQTEQKEILISLLDYCRSENINVFFVLTPYVCTIEDTKIYNSIASIIEEYGYEAINTNYLYDDMNLEFSEDFYNGQHTNIFGAEKFTNYLGNYICSNYGIENHLEDVEYDSWNDDYEIWETQLASCKELTLSIKEGIENGLKIEEKLRNTTEFDTWINLLGETRFAFLISVNDELENLDSLDRAYLETICAGREFTTGEMRVVWNGQILQDTTSESLLQGTDIYGWKIRYSIENENGMSSIQVNDEEYCKNQEGINVVVVDVNYLNVVDSVAIRQDGTGSLKVFR